jgi:hypothetical protein
MRCYLTDPQRQEFTMRLAGQQKGGYYPAPPAAIAAALDRLQLAPKTSLADITVLDPCAGEGLALAQIRDTLGIPEGNAYGIELDMVRGERLRAAIYHNDKARVVSNVAAPSGALGTDVANNSFSLAWVNPPYDDELGGGSRVETSFLQWVTPKIRTGGVLMLVVPEPQTQRYGAICQWLGPRFDQVNLMPFPGGHRRFREVVVFGRKRESYVEDYLDGVPPLRGFEKWDLPKGRHPWIFQKFVPTDIEVGAMFAASPLQKLRQPPAELPLASPPMPLKTGHIAMLLSSSLLDGRLAPEGEPPHVVRGMAEKRKYLASREESEDESGNVSIKTVYSEKIELTVRAVWPDGTIRTFHQTPPEDDGNEAA